MEEHTLTKDSALGLATNARELDLPAAEADILMTRFPSDVVAAQFSDQSIVAETKDTPPAEFSERMLDHPPISNAEWESQMTFTQSFRARDESALIETIIPVVRTIPAQPALPAPAKSLVIAKPVSVVDEPQRIDSALTRIAQVRRALFGSAESSASPQSGANNIV
jgi:hypothetical protein